MCRSLARDRQLIPLSKTFVLRSCAPRRCACCYCRPNSAFTYVQFTVYMFMMFISYNKVLSESQERISSSSSSCKTRMRTQKENLWNVCIVNACRHLFARILSWQNIIYATHDQRRGCWCYNTLTIYTAYWFSYLPDLRVCWHYCHHQFPAFSLLLVFWILSPFGACVCAWRKWIRFEFLFFVFVFVAFPLRCTRSRLAIVNIVLCARTLCRSEKADRTTYFSIAGGAYFKRTKHNRNHNTQCVRNTQRAYVRRCHFYLVDHICRVCYCYTSVFGFPWSESAVDFKEVRKTA